ncbi:FmdB family zinc ribbon protein [Brevibacterium casei]|uniref:FmdB family zinc ribbon protein n=1 Tax=Brevibacterium casei TaxID=33889 RepID=UPI00241CCB4F|nr:FmdB family zinc ribbon protein [Brevibacterium casei]
MPVYSYACKSCGHKFDVHQDFSDDSLTVCPECQGQLKKVFGTVGISFKGSGFYATDSRKSTSSSVATASSKDSSSSDSSQSKDSSSSSPSATSSSSTAKAGASTAS